MPGAEAGGFCVVGAGGAYGSGRDARYDGGAHGAEVLVDGTNFKLGRPRESVESQWEAEKRLL